MSTKQNSTDSNNDSEEDRVTKVVPEEDAHRGKGEFADGEIRGHVYVDDNGNPYPSVTTILDTYEDEQKKQALKEWRDENDGSGDTESWEDILKYSQLRGTICHAKAQEKYVDRQVWGEEEDEALDELKEFGEFYGEDAHDRCMRGSEWFVEQIHDMLDDRVKEVVYVEQYVYSADPVYAGQADFVYINHDDELVVCDLKTSKNVSMSYFMQLSAYAHVIEQDLDREVDKLEVCRANPEHRTQEVETLTKEDDSIVLTDVVETEYGDKVAIQSPFEAKTDINGLDWNLHHQEWDDNLEQWLLTINNKDGITTIDLALNELTSKGWTVNVSYIEEKLYKHPSVSPDELHLDKPESEYDSHRDLVYNKFKDLAYDYEDDYLPIEIIEE